MLRRITLQDVNFCHSTLNNAPAFCVSAAMERTGCPTSPNPGSITCKVPFYLILDY